MANRLNFFLLIPLSTCNSVVLGGDSTLPSAVGGIRWVRIYYTFQDDGLSSRGRNCQSFCVKMFAICNEYRNSKKRVEERQSDNYAFTKMQSHSSVNFEDYIVLRG